MNVPDYPRVVFRRAPLALTLAQVRFGPRFRMEDPARLSAFQEKLENDFPQFSREAQMGFMVSSQGVQTQPGGTLNRFSSIDGRKSVVLGTDALTVEIRRFNTIEELRESFATAVGALIESFGPPIQTRLGLRFVNEIRHSSATSVEGWTNFLRPELIGAPALDEFRAVVTESLQQFVVADGEFNVIVRHGLVATGTTVPFPDASKEDLASPFYLLDLDCFSTATQQVDPSAVAAKIDEFNGVLYKIFRWAITEELYEYFEPVDAES